MATFSENLRAARKRAGLTQEALAEKCGFSGQSRIGNYEAAKDPRKPNIDDLKIIAAALEIDPGELLGVDELVDTDVYKQPRASGYLRPITTWDDPSELPSDQFVFLPKLDYMLSAGPGGPDPSAVEATDKLNPFRSDWVKSQGWSPRTHFTMRCKGESMEPTIQDKAPVVIDTSATGKRISSGKVYAILLDGEPLLKRLDKLPGGVIRVRSDNPAPSYAAFEVPEESLEVVGRAVWTPINL